MARSVALRLEPSSDRFDPYEDRWLDQVAGLVTELQGEVGTVSLARLPAPGSKGAVDAILVSVSSAAVLSPAVELLQGWLARDPSRSVTVTWTAGGDEHAVELAAGQGDAAFEELVQVVAQQLQAAT